MFLTCMLFAGSNMPRQKPKKPGIGKTTSGDMKKAVYDIVEGGLSTKASALKHNIPRTTLRRYLAKCLRNRDTVEFRYFTWSTSNDPKLHS